MADEATGTNNDATEETNSQGNDSETTFEAIESQEDFDKRIQARIARERSKFSDYDDLKARADRLAEIEESSKSEAERQAERMQQLEAENESLRVESLRASIAADKNVPAALLKGATQEELEASADALIEFKTAQQEQKERLHVPGEGRRPASSGTSAEVFAGWSEDNFHNL